MTRWAKSFGGFAIWAGCVLGAQAQFPGDGGGAMPEPLGMPSSGGGLVPGPISPLAAPPGPDDQFSLPASSPSAFMDDPRPLETAVFLHVGAIALKQFSPAGPVVATSPTASLSYSDVDPQMLWGGRGTLGILHENHAWEITGFYIPNHGSSNSAAPTSGTMTIPFGAIPPDMAATGLTNTANGVIQNYYSSFGNVELNYRTTNLAIFNFEAIVGLRYTDLQQSASTNYIGATPTASSVYSATTYNRMVLPQIGFEHNLQPICGVSLGSQYKVALGPNFTESQLNLNQGTGLNLLSNSANNTTFGQIYEINLFGNINLTERFRFKAGVDVIWANGIATPGNVLNYNISSPTISSRSGSSFYWGPTFELQFLF